MTYNSFAFVDIAIVLGVGILLFLSKPFMAQMMKSSDIGKSVQAAPVDEIEEVEEEDDGFVYLDDLKEQEKQTAPEDTDGENE